MKILIVTASILLTALVVPSGATLIGDFEYIGLPGGVAPEESWTGTGRAYTATSFGNINPTNGDRLAVIRNDDRTTNGTAPVSANALEAATNATNLDAFENSFRISGGGENVGSGLSASFSVEAGDMILFDWYFVTQEDSLNGFGTTFNDFAYVTLTSGGAVTPTLLADSNNSINSGVAGIGGLDAVNIGSQGAGTVDGGTFSNGTGWNTTSFTVGTTGTYTLSFGVIQVGDNAQAFPSALLVDNIQVVPESEIILALASLIVIWGAFRWKMVWAYFRKRRAPRVTIVAVRPR